MLRRIPKRCPRLEAILEVLQEISPLNLADVSWDNVGLMVEGTPLPTDRPVRILLTNDLTEPVAIEAMDYDMVISYHPPWFRSCKSLTLTSNKNLAFLASRGISVFSPHTALDNVNPGMNDWVLNYLFPSSIDRVSAIILTDETNGAGRMAELKEERAIDQVLKLVADKFQMKAMRYAFGIEHGLSDKVKSVAVCVGSGASVFSKLSQPVDLLLTGILCT